MSECENPRRQRLRIDRDTIEHGGLVEEFETALQSTHDDDAAGDTIEFIGGQCFALEGCCIGHGRSPLFGRGTLPAGADNASFDLTCS
jgi:hypothetical protein